MRTFFFPDRLKLKLWGAFLLLTLAGFFVFSRGFTGSPFDDRPDSLKPPKTPLQIFAEAIPKPISFSILIGWVLTILPLIYLFDDLLRGVNIGDWFLVISPIIYFYILACILAFGVRRLRRIIS